MVLGPYLGGLLRELGWDWISILQQQHIEDDFPRKRLANRGEGHECLHYLLYEEGVCGRPCRKLSRSQGGLRQFDLSYLSYLKSREELSGAAIRRISPGETHVGEGIRIEWSQRKY